MDSEVIVGSRLEMGLDVDIGVEMVMGVGLGICVEMGTGVGMGVKKEGNNRPNTIEQKAQQTHSYNN